MTKEEAQSILDAAGPNLQRAEQLLDAALHDLPPESMTARQVRCARLIIGRLHLDAAALVEFGGLQLPLDGPGTRSGGSK
jgi:hypothetical protein